MSTKPTYSELALAFEEYLACTDNDGEPVIAEEGSFERALAVMEQALPREHRRYYTGVDGT